MAFQYDASWNGQRAKQITTEQAMGRIKRMITASLINCQAVRRDNTARARYATHFNDPGLNQLATVTGILRTLDKRINLNGQDINLTLMLVAPPGLILPPGANWGNCEACAVPGNPAPNVPVTVNICPAFFTGNVYVPRNDPTQRSGTGTVIHELTHACCNTADHGYSWQGNYAAMTAANRTTNADTYRMYCQEFDVIRI